MDLQALSSITSLRQARKFLKEHGDELAAAFDEQFPNNAIGGFHNPRVVDMYDEFVAFRCHYNGFDNEDDSWTWVLNTLTGEFSN